MHSYTHNCFLNRPMGTWIVSRDLAKITVILLWRSLLSADEWTLSACSLHFVLWNCHAMKLTKWDLDQLFGGKHIPHTPHPLYSLVLPTLLIYLRYLFSPPPLFPLLPSLLLPVASHFPSLSSFPYFYPHTSPLLLLSPLLLPSTLVSICCVWVRLHGWRKGKERSGLVWIKHAAAVCTNPVGTHQMLALQIPCFCLFCLS